MARFPAGGEAWKIKRAVRFPYMDFSTLEKRRVATTREVEINQRLAPEIYLGVVPITRGNDGQLEVGGSGEIVEWAVHMQRFEQNGTPEPHRRHRFYFHRSGHRPCRCGVRKPSDGDTPARQRRR
jgi:hypothetical protein